MKWYQLFPSFFCLHFGESWPVFLFVGLALFISRITVYILVQAYYPDIIVMFLFILRIDLVWMINYMVT